MDLAPKTTEDLEKLVEHLRRIGVQHYSAHGVSLVLCAPAPVLEKTPEEAPARGPIYGMTEEEQIDTFRYVVEPVAKEKAR